MTLIIVGLILILVGFCLFFYSGVLFLLNLRRKNTEYDRFCADFDAKYSDILPKKRHKIHL